MNLFTIHRGDGMRHWRCFLAVLGIIAAPGVFAQVPRRPFLFKDSRGEVAAARARGERDVLLVIASMPGANASVANTITSLGGTVQFRDDDVDYLRGRVPVDHVEQLAGHALVHSLDVSISRGSRVFGSVDVGGGGAAFLPSSGALPTAPQDSPKPVWPPMLSNYPLTNRYSPLADIGAAEFRKANPTFDGRGVTIALIDNNPDPLLPELQAALTLDGKPTPKIVVFETAIDAEEEDDGRWIRMAYTAVAADGRLAYQGKTYTAPRAGTFRIGMLDEIKFDSVSGERMDKDLNRDGNPSGSSRLFAVLWDEGTNEVWVDTNQDESFLNEKALTDFSVRPEFGILGKDKPETPIRESVAFGVQINRAKKLVGLNFGIGSHPSLVIGAAVASRGTAGRFDGVAPGARLASISEGGAAYGQTEAVIRAFKNPLVDVVFLEQSSLITRSYLLRDGRQVPTVIYGRLIEKYKKPLIVPTHNYPILGGIDDFVLARGAIGIGGHESGDNFFTNHGVRVEHQDNLLITGGYGPMGDGALKPDVISPSNYVSTARGFDRGGAIPGLFQLPPGYTIAGGTSTATPTAAAAVGLLISAAKQAGVTYDAFRIKHAITMSARYVPHLPAYKQGNGVVNVAGAWEILKALDKAGDPVTLTSRAPVRHAYSRLLPTPHEGVGLYERDGWTSGDHGERILTFTRTSGPKEPMTFALSWTGNDDSTFSAPPSVTLPLNAPVPITVTIEPRAPGAHTALLTLDHASIPGHAYRMLTTVVAAEPLTASNNFTIETKTEVPRPGMRSFFYRVPEGSTALRIDLDTPKRIVALTVVRPDTRTAPGTRLVAARSGRGGGGSQGSGGEKATFVVAEPMPGVWEVRLTDIEDTRTFDWQQAEKSEPVPPTTATLTVSALAAEVTVADGEVYLSQPGAVSGGATKDLSITNRMAAFTGSVASVPVGSARRERHTIREKEQQVFEVEVLPGSTAFVARAFRLSDPGADIDVSVFDGTGEKVQAGGMDGDPVGEESVIVQNPAAGKWKIVVDALTVPSGSTAFEYLDVVFNPSYGMVSIADLPQERSVGARWTVKAHTWISVAAHAPGREPYPAVLVQGQVKDAGSFLVSLQTPAAILGSEKRPDKK